MRFKSLIIALLLMFFLVPAAGAIYIPGQEIPNDGQPHILSADGQTGSNTVVDTGGPIKKYLSDDPNDYVLVPGNDPDMMYALGDMPVEPGQPSAISAPVTKSTNMPSYVGKPLPPPPTRFATYASSETVMPPDIHAPPNSSKFNPSVNGLQHLDAASKGYDVSKIGSIAMPPTPARTPASLDIPEFKFPALFG